MFIIGKGATYNRSLLIYIIMCTPNVPLQKQRRCFALPTPMFQRNNAVVSNQAHRGIFILSQISNIIQRSHINHGNHRKANAMFVDMKKLAAWLSVISVLSMRDKTTPRMASVKSVPSVFNIPNSFFVAWKRDFLLHEHPKPLFFQFFGTFSCTE